MIWAGTMPELLVFLENLNSKHQAIKIDQKLNISDIFQDKCNTHKTTLYQKPTDQQSFLHAHSDHPKSLKKTPYSQAFKIKTSCSTLTEY